jgi:DNA invertase Pin-like site-specific DNA recombinase
LCDAPDNLNPLICMKKIAYARVSTPDQRHDRQIEGLKAFCDELHIETLSACAARRPVYDRVVAKLRPGDMLVVWDLDRAFRSVVDALTEAEKLRGRGIHFQIANLSIDTSTPAGIFVYTMLSALAEFERRTLSQRTREGLEAARARGARIGRPPRLNDRQLVRARRRIEHDNMSVKAVAEELGVPRWTLVRSLRRQDQLI